MFDELTQLFGVKRVISRIEAFAPLPPLEGPFDLVTGYRVCFNNHKQSDLWNVAEWDRD